MSARIVSHNRYPVHCCITADANDALTVQRRGKKVLMLDPRVSGFLGLLAEVSLLKEHGIEQYACS